jgi:hypothetical protein
MNNHLIIGLGGTGGRIIRALRKIIYQEFRRLQPPGLNLAYLYVDSDDEMMALDDPRWKILGHSVQLGIDSQLHIQGADLEERLNNIHNYPGIKAWIGNRDDWKDILRSFAGGRVYGGQKRRLGRFLLACNIDAFISQLTLQVNQLQHLSNQADVTFHICCGLAGGTGSGSVIDTIVQIRKHYPYSSQGLTYPLLVYAYLPEKNPNPKWDTGNYQSNGYAALMELNALSAGRWDPHDLTSGGPVAGGVAFNGLYLFTNQNEKNVMVGVENEIPQIVADFLYQKIIAVRNVAWTSLAFLEDAQNGDSTPETAPIPNSRLPERAKRFLTFGINRIAIPEEEIKEYLTYHFAHQAALQLQFNHWDDSVGFVDYPKTTAVAEVVLQPAIQAKWLITDEHLCLSKGILASDIDKKWNSLDEEWQSITPHLKEVASNGEKNERLERLEKLFQKRFEQDFRSRQVGDIGGVENFYRLKQPAQKIMAKEIVQRIEEELFTDWKNGTQALQEITQLVAALITSLKERKRYLAQQITNRDNQLRGANKQIALIKNQWLNKGWLTNTRKLFDNQAENLKDSYRAKTWIIALHFADKLIDELIHELNSLQAQLLKVTNTLSEAIKEFTTLIEQRLNDNSALPNQQPTRLYDPNLIKSITKQLTSDEALQRTSTTTVRNEIISKLGKQPNFFKLTQLNRATVLDTLVITSANNAQLGHDQLIPNSKERLFGVNILDKLQERYDGQTLRWYVAELVKYACNYLSFDNAEIQKSGLGIPSTPTKFSRFTVILPQAPQQANFIAQLKAVFRQSYSGEIEFLESDVKPNEIVMINITNLFPLRFVTQVNFLRQKYLSRLSQPDSVRAKLELHLEGDGSQFPSLFVPSSEEIKQQVIPYLLLAKVMNLIIQSEDVKTGPSQFFLPQKDEEGFDQEPIDLGENFIESYEQLDLSHLEPLKQQVQALLDSEYRHRDQRNHLKTAILEEVNRIKQNECHNDIKSQLYQVVNEGGKAAVKILKQG